MTIRYLMNTILAITTLMAALCPSTSLAQGIVNWIDPAGGFFDVGSNWSSGTMPGASDSATFAVAGTYDVDWDVLTGDVVTDDLFVLNGDVSFRSLGSATGGLAYTYRVNDDLTVGIGATLRIGDGSDGHHLIVGDEMLVDAAELRSSRNGSLTGMGPIDIGASDNANGFLNLQDTQFDATGIIRAGIGANAQGRIVAADETVANTTNVDIGTSSTGNGRLEVVGENTVWNSTSELDIGNNGPGVMEVRLGGTVNSEISAVGWQSGGDGDVIVRHTGSAWNIEQRLDIGGTPNTVGTLLLEQGGSVSSFGVAVTIGSFTDLPGCAVTVRDPGSILFSNNRLEIGGMSTGTLNITNEANVLALGAIIVHPGSVVNVGGSITQGLTGNTMTLEGDLNLLQGCHVNIGTTLDIESTGRVDMIGLGLPNLEANQINNSGIISFLASSDLNGDVVNTGTIESLSPTFNILFDSLVNSGVVETEAGAWTRIDGDLSGDGSFTGNGRLQALAAVRPGAGNGVNVTSTIPIGGDFWLGNSSSLEIEIGGTDPTQFDRLTVAGDTHLLGSTSNLLVSSLGSFTPSMGDVFIFFEIDGNRTGEFNGLPQGTFVANLNGQDLFIDYTAGDGNDIALTTTSVGGVLLGDVNLDGSVDLLDVNPFVDLITTGTFQTAGDINQDGVVNLLDVGPFVDLLSGG